MAGTKRVHIVSSGNGWRVKKEGNQHYQKAISDLSGIDILMHAGEEEEIVRCVRNWFYTKKTSIKQATAIWDDYNAFVAHLDADLNEKDVLGMPMLEYIDKAREYIRDMGLL